MATLLIKIDTVNATKGHRIHSDNGFNPTYHETLGDLFRDLTKDYGRCKGRVYRDTKVGTVRVGWTFEKRERYTDTKASYYLQETWVEVYQGEHPTFKKSKGA